MFNAKITWGDELTLALRRAGGLQPVAKQLRGVLGFLAPSRATLAKLQKVERPDQLSEEDAFRASLVLIAIGESPERWQLPVIDLPSVFDMDQYRKLVSYTAGDLNPEPADLVPMWFYPRKTGVRREAKPRIIPSVLPTGWRGLSEDWRELGSTAA